MKSVSPYERHIPNLREACDPISVSRVCWLRKTPATRHWDPMPQSENRRCSLVLGKGQQRQEVRFHKLRGAFHQIERPIYLGQRALLDDLEAAREARRLCLDRQFLI